MSHRRNKIILIISITGLLIMPSQLRRMQSAERDKEMGTNGDW